MPIVQRREATREVLARMILGLLTLLVCVTVTVVIFQGRLGVTPEAVHILERVFLAVVGLSVFVARYYFH